MTHPTTCNPLRCRLRRACTGAGALLALLAGLLAGSGSCAAVAEPTAGGASAAAAPPLRIWHSYREIYDRLQLHRFYDVAAVDRRLLVLKVKLSAEKHPGQPVALTVDDPVSRVTLAADARGLVDFPYEARWLRDDPKVLVALPEGERIAAEYDLSPVLPRQLDLDYVELLGSIPQANQVISRQAGLLSLLAPTLHVLVLHYARPVDEFLEWQEGGKVQRLAADAKGDIRIPLDKTRWQQNPRVRLSSLPISADFEP